jgi:hypothetical protein
MLNFLLSLVVGALIWILWPIITGIREPWDSNAICYPAVLLLSGFILGLLRPQHFWVHYVGILFGQFVYTFFFVPAGPLLPIGIALMVFYSVLTLIGAAIAAGLRRLFR